MPENILQPNVSGDKKSSWMELFLQGRGPYTVLLNLGIGLHAIDIFIITTVMPTVVEDIGGLRYYTWTSMLYMVGTIVGAAAGSHLRDQFGARLGYFWGGMLLLIGTIGCAISPDTYLKRCWWWIGDITIYVVSERFIFSKNTH